MEPSKWYNFLYDMGFIPNVCIHYCSQKENKMSLVTFSVWCLLLQREKSPILTSNAVHDYEK